MKEDQTAVKLAELRAKTDRQVLEYIREQLKAAAQYAFEADQACRTKNFARARRCRERADSAIRLAKELKAIVVPLSIQPEPASGQRAVSGQPRTRESELVSR